MSTEAYLTWDGMTQETRLIATNLMDLSGWEKGFGGFLHDGNGDTPILKLVPEGYTDEVTPLQAAAVSSEVLGNRLPAALQKARERHPGSNEYREEMLVGFVVRVAQLEAQGLNPRVWVSW